MDQETIDRIVKYGNLPLESLLVQTAPLTIVSR